MTDQDQQPDSDLSIDDLKQMLAEKDSELANYKNQFNAVKSKADQLLDETKKAKQKEREAAEAAQRASEEKARKNGDYEQLLKSSEQQRKELDEQLNALRNKVSSERTRSESMKIASELADGANAELLSEFVSRRLKYTDDGLKVLDQNGDLTVSSIDDLKREFETSEKFKALLRGNKSSGGGATGGGNGVSQIKTLSRSKFEALDATAKMQFFKDGGKLADE